MTIASPEIQAPIVMHRGRTKERLSRNEYIRPNGRAVRIKIQPTRHSKRLPVRTKFGFQTDHSNAHKIASSVSLNVGAPTSFTYVH
jgi:hypothetical protein